MIARVAVAAVAGLGCVWATAGVDFWILWVLDGGWEPEPAAAYTGLLAATFLVATLVSRLIPTPQPEWSASAVGVGATVGMAVMLLSLQMVSEDERFGFAHVAAFVLSTIGAFGGTFYRSAKVGRPRS